MQRISNVLWGIGVIAAVSLAGCGNETGGGATTATGTATSPLACAPAPSCQVAEAACLGLVDNAGKTRFGLRVSEIDIRAPALLSAGIVGLVVASDVLPSNHACNLDGSGTFSVLLRFDLEAGTLEVGGAKPVADATKGYRFVDEVVTGRHVHPATYDLALGADGGFVVPDGKDLLLPVYLDTADTVVLFPVRSARISAGALSTSRGCIGAYDVAHLDPANGCLPVGERHAFVTGASLEGFLTVEDADTVLIPASAATLCASLAGGALVTTNAEGLTVCKRDAEGRILFQGDTCSIAGETCTDAIAVAADFAASSVRIDD